MSGTQPPRPGQQPAIMAPRLTAQGMIGPQQFVLPNGDLTAVSFRFLNSTFDAVASLQDEVRVLQQRLTNAGIP